MNKESIEELKVRDPEEGPPFQFRPGRFYSKMWSMAMPPQITRFQKGGDLLAMLWRKDDDPQTWYLMYRFRYYKVGSGRDPFNGEDEKSWFKTQFLAKNEAEALHGIEEFLKMMAASVRLRFGIDWGNLDSVEIHGDCDACFRTFEEQKPTWMHMRTQVAE